MNYVAHVGISRANPRERIETKVAPELKLSHNAYLPG